MACQQYSQRDIFSITPGLAIGISCSDIHFLLGHIQCPTTKWTQFRRNWTAQQHTSTTDCSSSPYSNPLVVMVKKDKSIRLCVDSRALNKIMLKIKIPLNQQLKFWVGLRRKHTLVLSNSRLLANWARMGVMKLLKPFSSEESAINFDGCRLVLNVTVGLFRKWTDKILGLKS